jgi:hypothetical protein
MTEEYLHNTVLKLRKLPSHSEGKFSLKGERISFLAKFGTTIFPSFYALKSVNLLFVMT